MGEIFHSGPRVRGIDYKIKCHMYQNHRCILSCGLGRQQALRPGALHVWTASASCWLHPGPAAEMGHWAEEREEKQRREQAFLHESRGHKQTRFWDNSYNNLKNPGNDRCQSLRNTPCHCIGFLELLKPPVHFTGLLKNFKCKDKKLTDILSFGSLKKKHTSESLVL